MDFTFINELSKLISENDIFKFSFAGAKVIGMALLLLRILEVFSKDFIGTTEPKIGNSLAIMGYGVVIMSSGWIVDSIENLFSGVDVAMHKTSSDLYEELNDMIRKKATSMLKGSEGFFDVMGVILSSIGMMGSMLFMWLIGGLCKLADLSITASYLVQRVFILKLLKILFPIALGLSTYSGTQKLFHTWILRYIGMFILGIAYIGIINLMSLVQTSLISQFSSENTLVDGGSFAVGILVTMITTFAIKIKLFAMVTNYVMGMFQ